MITSRYTKHQPCFSPARISYESKLTDCSQPQARVRCIVIIGNLSTRRSWFTNGMAGRAELDRGRGLRAKCKSLSKTTWNHHERRQNNSVENAFQRFEWSFVFFLRRKHDFGRKIATFVWRILFEKPRIWTSGFNLRSRVLKSVTATQECLDMRSGCHAAKILPVGVRGTKNVWCLSSLWRASTKILNWFHWRKH